ncbi:MAG: CDP-glucose 4,6-dehydratase [Selenomonadaceae bacterium]|nr:CDP-glucose 4,6-dehydratase [Selenomonadaceae bacterium]
MALHKNFWEGKKVFITGHTGFKGAWLAFILQSFGADVTGYALEPPTTPNLFNLIRLNKFIHSTRGDVRNLMVLRKIVNQRQPEIVFHLAAQPLVLEGYNNPPLTYETNVMGTVNLLESIRNVDSVRSVINVTTDKVYHNNEWAYGYRETDLLDGIDPYSNSKSCAELVTNCYVRSFLADKSIAVSTVRAGNVIGGGDFADHRLVPDCVRAALKLETIEVRNPNAVRPFQHVLEPLIAYIMIAEAQYNDATFADCYNIGPDADDCISTGKLVRMFCELWGDGLDWEAQEIDQPREANFLKLDCSKFKQLFDWSPRWSIRKALEKTIEWTKIYQRRGNLLNCMTDQLNEYLEGASE